MKETILTNEWTDAVLYKPWQKRFVLVRLENGAFDIAYWGGLYWCAQNGKPYKNGGGEITHFYVFERFVPYLFNK